MIKCPRCGFTQPKDKYCAQCGLDIENYRPPKAPLHQKILKDPLVQMAAILFVASSAGYFVYKNNRIEIQERVSFFRQGIQFSKNATHPSVAPSANDSPAPAETSSAEAPPAGLLEGAENASANVSPPEANAGAESPKTTANETKSAGPEPSTHQSLTVRYAEIPERFLEQIYAESSQSGQLNRLGDNVAGIWPQGKKRVAQERNWKWLGKETKPLGAEKPLQYFVGLRGADPESDLGLTTYIEVDRVDADMLHGSLEVVRSWRENAQDGQVPGQIQRRFYPAPLDLPADAYFIMVGVLPRNTPMETDPYLTNIDPFKILKTAAFKNRQTEFLMLVEFEK